MSQHVFHVSGMHCKACILLVEDELTDLPEISRAKVSLKYHHVELEGEFGGRSAEEIIAFLTPPLQKHGYSLSLEKAEHVANWGEFGCAVPLALLFLSGFVALQKLGIVNLLTVNEISYPAAFLIGLVASVSSCMAVVGGLTLSVSANFAKEGERFRPQVLFHVGRLVSFYLLGGLVGVIGGSFQISPSVTMWLSMAVGLIMLVLGLNLLDLFPWIKRLQPTLPGFISRHLLLAEKLNHTLTPAILGAVTFFLPCGFTQSMQLYALSSGSFITGSLTMLVFALGTLPVLALLSFASLSLHSRKASGIFFKTAGLVVIAFALFNLMNGLVVAGIIQPIVRL